MTWKSRETHVLAQHDAQQLEFEPPRIESRTGMETHREVGLLGFFLLKRDVRATMAVARRDESWCGASFQLPSICSTSGPRRMLATSAAATIVFGLRISGACIAECSVRDAIQALVVPVSERPSG